MGRIDSASPADPDESFSVDGSLFAGLSASAELPAEIELTAPDDEPRARATERRRRRLGRYFALVAGLGVAVSAVLVGPTLWHVYGARHTTLSLPTSVGGLSRDTGSDSRDTADYLRDAVHTGTSLAHPLGAVYDLNGDRAHSVLLFGGSGAVFRPDHTLSTVLGLLDDSSDGISGLHAVAAGPLGGTMMCGRSVGAAGDPTDADMPICGWADYGSVAAALFPGRTVDEAAELMRQFRAAVEHH